MDESNSIIYGLEFQARSLASQQAESNDVRFFIATQSLKPNNQLHIITLNDNWESQNTSGSKGHKPQSSIETKIFSHPYGEVWQLNASPHCPNTLASCFSAQKGAKIVMQTAIIKLPESFDHKDSSQDFLQFENAEILDVESYGHEIKTTEFHPTDPNTLAQVVDGRILLYNRAQSQTKVVAEINAKNSPKFSGGKWSLFNQGNQFIALHDCSVKSYDIRDPNHCAWQIEDAHSQLVRDIDCNPNKQCHIVTGGDDGSLKIWDCRMTKEQVFARNDHHHHWIWSVRFNRFHDQLILSSSSDGKVLLTCAGSVSSEAPDVNESTEKEVLADGLLQTFDQHEDSVYCAEWSSADPWIFASLSYDGRVIISKVPKQYKYQILL